MFQTTTIQHVRQALKALTLIKCPEGDNEGCPINAPDVYNSLSDYDQALVDEVKVTVRNYVLHPDGEVNNRNVTTISRNGHSISIGPDQYDPMRISGTVKTGEWTLIIGDPELPE